VKSIALASYPQASESQVDLAAEMDMAILQDLIVSVRNLRAELKVEPKVKVPIEVFSHGPEILNLIQNNNDAILRLASVESIREATQAQATKAPARSTARFDVHVVYERKVDVAAECERLKREMEKTEKGIANLDRQLGNDQFLAKAPANVVGGMRKQRLEMEVMREKTKNKLVELGC
jgi:valyl-tRNA synthetase